MDKKPKNNIMPLACREEIENALDDLNGWGSVEIFVQGNKIVQITHRSIRKTNHVLNKPSQN